MYRVREKLNGVSSIRMGAAISNFALKGDKDHPQPGVATDLGVHNHSICATQNYDWELAFYIIYIYIYRIYGLFV